MALKTLSQAWLILAKNNLQAQLLTRSNASLFIIGKLLNFAFTLVLVFSIFKTTSLVKGYTLDQALIFVMVFNLTDSISGFLFRSIYMFRPILLRGDFDLDLVKPLPSFFRPLLSAPDFLDLPPILIQFAIFVAFLLRLNQPLEPLNYLMFAILLFCAILVTFALYLTVASLSIVTTEIDNLMSIIRSVSRAGIMPTDIYQGFFRFFLTFVIPITLIVTIPSKAILGLLDPLIFILLIFTSIGLVGLSLFFWRLSLRYYTSASS